MRSALERDRMFNSSLDGGRMSLDYSESVLTFRCESDELLGIVSVSLANESANDVGIIIVVGGPQYRAGSHRQFVQLARSLAGSA